MKAFLYASKLLENSFDLRNTFNAMIDSKITGSFLKTDQTFSSFHNF